MNPDRILEVADGVVAKIKAAWKPEGDDGVSREYVAPVKVEQLVGRKVYVFPADYGSPEPATRSEDVLEFKVALVVAERYVQAAPVPKDWLDERVEFVGEFIWRLLTNARDESPLLGTLWPHAADVSVYDVDLLYSDKMFWSEIEITYREVDQP